MFLSAVALASTVRQATRTLAAMALGSLGAAIFSIYTTGSSVAGGGTTELKRGMSTEQHSPSTPVGLRTPLPPSEPGEPPAVIVQAPSKSKVVSDPLPQRHLVTAVQHFLSRPRPNANVEYAVTGGLGFSRNRTARVMAEALNQSMTYLEATEKCKKMRKRAGLSGECSYHETVAAAAMHMLPSLHDEIRGCMEDLWRNASEKPDGRI